ncbi:MAG TPA: hypothetical protein VKA49_03010 [Flavitalea sp.]|nr:hypothetical protein [Flavitalea sp.]
MKKDKLLKTILTCLVFFGIFLVPVLFDGLAKKIAYGIIFAAGITLGFIIFSRSRREV